MDYSETRLLSGEEMTFAEFPIEETASLGLGDSTDFGSTRTEIWNSDSNIPGTYITDYAG